MSQTRRACERPGLCLRPQRPGMALGESPGCPGRRSPLLPMSPMGYGGFQRTRAFLGAQAMCLMVPTTPTDLPICAPRFLNSSASQDSPGPASAHPHQPLASHSRLFQATTPSHHHSSPDPSFVILLPHEQTLGSSHSRGDTSLFHSLPFAQAGPFPCLSRKTPMHPSKPNSEVASSGLNTGHPPCY